MFPKITIFVHQPSLPRETELVKKFHDLGYYPLVDANRRDITWFEKNVKKIPHALFDCDLEEKSVNFYHVNDLSPLSDVPHFMISFNEMDQEQIDQMPGFWQDLRTWLLYYICGKEETFCYTVAFGMNELLEKPVFVEPFVSVEGDEIKHEAVQQDQYSFQTCQKDKMMFYEVWKPHTDFPYVFVNRRFDETGHLPFFTALFICQSWGVDRNDIEFLKFLWTQIGMEGKLTNDKLDVLLKEATESCYPSSKDAGNLEPEVYRKPMTEVIKVFNEGKDKVCSHHAEYLK